MAGVDPLAAVAADVAEARAAVADAALELGAIAQILKAQLSVGDVLEATVLPAQGGHDLIEILGQTVVAHLPLNVHPGDTLLLQVTGFQGNQILVRNMGVQDPSNPIPTFVLDVPPTPAEGAATATLTTIVSNPGGPAAPAPVSGGAASGQTPQPQAPLSAAGSPPESDPPVAPPREVFVAASVRPPPASLPTQQQPAQGGAAARQLPPPLDVDARLVATRVATTERFGQAASAPAPIALSKNSAPSAAASAPASASLPRPTSAPGAVPRPTSAPATAPRPTNLPVPPPLMQRAGQAAHASVSAPAAQPRLVAAQLAAAVESKEPVRILAALRVPATPVTLAAARLVTTAGTQIASALQNLERALAQNPMPDSRVATLQTLTSFLVKLDPSNVQTLTAQLSSFVSNVIEGSEKKIAQLLDALSPRLPEATNSQAQPAAVTQSMSSVQSHPSGAQQIAPSVPIVAEARAAESQMALTQDLKSTIMSLLANPPAGATPALTQALHQGLTALTAVQFNSLIGAQTDPTTIALTIPMTFYQGGQQANIRISRDAPQNKRGLDADNFHIAFVLDTASLGTVAIDLETVGRSVKLNVKTDRATAVDRFKSSLGDLRARLEHLRYKIASAGADMIGAKAAAPPVSAIAQPSARAASGNLDLQA